MYLSELPQWSNFNEYTEHIFHDKIRKLPQNICFLGYEDNFLRTKNEFDFSHGKQAMGAWVTEFLLYWHFLSSPEKKHTL